MKTWHDAVKIGKEMESECMIKSFDFRRFLQINIGVIIMTVGLYFFLIGNHLVVGGISGLAVILQHFYPNFPISALMMVMNIILFIIAFLCIGKDFGGYTLFTSFATSGYLWILETLFPGAQMITSNTLLNLIFGGGIAGVGMGIIFYCNASTGGTDIIGKIINMITKVDIGKCILIADLMIIIAAAAVFGIELGMYALLGAFLQAAFIDYTIAGFHRRVEMKIHSKNYEKINDFIHNELKRGTTLYETVGGFSKNKSYVLQTILSKREYIRVKTFVEGVDSQAFITAHYISEAMGEGFTYDSFGHFRLPKRNKES